MADLGSDVSADGEMPHPAMPAPHSSVMARAPVRRRRRAAQCPSVEVRAEIVPWNATPFVRASPHEREVSRLPIRIPFPTLRTFHTTAARRISSRGLPYSPQTTRKCNTKAERSSAKFVYYPVSHHGSVCSKPRPFRIFAFPLVSCSSIVYQRFAWVQTGLGQCHEASTASHQQK